MSAYDLNPKLICKDIALLDPTMQKAVAMLGKKKGFIIVETRRSLARQKMLMAQGASKTLKSYHLLGLAVDIMPIGGYQKFGKKDWIAAHNEWDKICATLGRKSRAPIDWDLGHFQMMEKK